MTASVRRSWLARWGLGKWPVLALAFCVAPVSAVRADAPAELGASEAVWWRVARGGEAPSAADGADARLTWLADRGLRGSEDTDPEAAAAAYAIILAAAEAGGDSLGVLVALERLAILDIDAGRIALARERLERCRTLAGGLPMAGALADLNLGRVLVRTREIDLAAERLQAAYDATLALDLPRWRGDAAIALSVVARLRMDLDTALARREEAYAAYTDAGYLPGRARALHFIGTTYAMRGDLTAAMVRLQDAEDLARRAGDPEILSGCLGDQAGILFLTGDFAGATARYTEGLELSRDPRRRGWWLSNLASILADQGRYAEALPRYAEALELVRASGDRRAESTILLVMGQCRCVLGDVDAGLADLDAALAHAREYGLPLDEAKALEVKGHALIDEDRLAEAEPLLRDAVARADRLGYFDLQASARKGLAEIARRQGRLDEAEQHLTLAVETVLQVRRRSGGAAGVQQGFFGEANDAFDALVEVLYQRHLAEPEAGHDQRAWAVAQQGRSRSLLDMLAEAEVDLRVRADDSYRRREEELLQVLAAVQERITAAPDSASALAADVARLESRLDVLEAELRRADPRYAGLRYPQPVDLARARSTVLRPGEVVLEFQLGQRHSHAWVVAADRFVMVRLAPRAAIEDAVRDLLPLLHDPSLTAGAAAWYTVPARAVASLVLDPVLPALTGMEALVVVPDGLLHYLPLDALPTADASPADYRDVPWLARRLAVTAAPSMSTLAWLRDLPPVPEDAAPLLLLADPRLPRPEETSVFARAAGAGGLSPVPGAAAEQQRLIDLYGRSARWYAGDAATAARLAPDAAGARSWRSIHLVTHGLYNEDRPRYSGLVLAPGDGDDGFLSVADIFALDLDCGQVVVSACSSALGEVVDGEGLVGLAQAFLYAGARSVVAALWDVDGDGAARFMGDYHAGLAADASAGRSATLAATKRTLATTPGATVTGVPWAHPNVWAAFMAIGDGR